MTRRYWNADSDLDWNEPNMPEPVEEDDERENVSECDACGKRKEGCTDFIWHGVKVRACRSCRESDDEDPSADRGDWRFHQRNDQ